MGGIAAVVTGLTSLFTVASADRATGTARRESRKAETREAERVEQAKTDTEAATAKAEADALAIEEGKTKEAKDAEALRRKRLKAAGKQGRPSTFATSSFGLTGTNTSTQKKTLLGGA